MEQDGPGSLNPHQNLNQLRTARRGIPGNANSSFAGDGKQVLICPRAQDRHKDCESRPRALHKVRGGNEASSKPQPWELTRGIYVIGFGSSQSSTFTVPIFHLMSAKVPGNLLIVWLWLKFMLCSVWLVTQTIPYFSFIICIFKRWYYFAFCYITQKG